MESDVSVREVPFPSGNFTLEGTFLHPPGKQLPAAVLVQGTGPFDRDETIGARKPFRDIARGLALLGIATFRFDKRTYTYFGRPEIKQFTVEEEVIVDALSAIAFVRKQEDIDPSRVFVIGHSLGGAMLSYIATRDSLLAGAIMLAPPAKPPEEIMATQTEYQMRLKERSQVEIDSTVIQALNVFSALRKDQEIDSHNFLGYPAGYWHDFLKRKPLLTVSKTRLPILILQGQRDYQVTVEDFNLWIKTLASRPNSFFEHKVYPLLDHTFSYYRPKRNSDHLFPDTAGNSCSCNAYAFPRQVDKTVIKDIADFIERW